MNTTNATADQPLDCGHAPSPHSPHTTGTAHTPDGQHICWTCANTREREALKTATTYGAYLVRTSPATTPEHAACYELQTWPGGPIALVTKLWQTSAGGFARRTQIYRFHAVDVHGQRWYGTSPGPGMYARMHKAK